MLTQENILEVIARNFTTIFIQGGNKSVVLNNWLIKAHLLCVFSFISNTFMFSSGNEDIYIYIYIYMNIYIYLYIHIFVWLSVYIFLLLFSKGDIPMLRLNPYIHHYIIDIINACTLQFQPVESSHSVCVTWSPSIRMCVKQTPLLTPLNGALSTLNV